MVTLDIQRFREVPPASYKKWDDPREVGGITCASPEEKTIHTRTWIRELRRHRVIPCSSFSTLPTTGTEPSDWRKFQRQEGTDCYYSEAVQSSLQTPCISKINRRRHIGFSTFDNQVSRQSLGTQHEARSISLGLHDLTDYPRS